MLKRLFCVLCLGVTLFIGGCAFSHLSAAQKNDSAGKPESAEAEAPAVAAVPKADLLKQYKMDSAFIIIRKGRFEVDAVGDSGEIIATWPCALGKNPGQKEREGDMKTPEGTFVIDEIIDASAWTHDFHDGKGEIQGAYGPWFISLNTDELSKGRWGGIGIHGTHAPASIGKLVSEGCIRLRNEDIQQLKQFARVGMRVVIEP